MRKHMWLYQLWGIILIWRAIITTSKERTLAAWEFVLPGNTCKQNCTKWRNANSMDITGIVYLSLFQKLIVIIDEKSRSVISLIKYRHFYQSTVCSKNVLTIKPFSGWFYSSSCFDVYVFIILEQTFGPSMPLWFVHENPSTLWESVKLLTQAASRVGWLLTPSFPWIARPCILAK